MTLLAPVLYAALIVAAALYGLARLRAQDCRIAALSACSPTADGNAIRTLDDRLTTLGMQIGKLVPLVEFDGLAETVSNHSAALRDRDAALADRPTHAQIDGLVKGIEVIAAGTELRLVAAEARLDGIAAAASAPIRPPV